jgi:hypothetical protein
MVIAVFVMIFSTYHGFGEDIRRGRYFFGDAGRSEAYLRADLYNKIIWHEEVLRYTNVNNPVPKT